jgi:hypothetical protein
MVWSLLRIDLTLIGGPAPEALSELLAETAGDYFCAKAGVRLVRGDVVDAGVVVLVVVPVRFQPSLPRTPHSFFFAGWPVRPLGRPGHVPFPAAPL